MRRLCVILSVLLITIPTLASEVELRLGDPNIVEQRLAQCEVVVEKCEELVEAQDALIEQQTKELDVVREQIQETEDQNKFQWILMSIVSGLAAVGGILIGVAI